MDPKEYVKDFKGLQKTSMDFIKDKWTLGILVVLLKDFEVTSNTRDGLTRVLWSKMDSIEFHKDFIECTWTLGNLIMTFKDFVDAFYNKEGLPMDHVK